jgi:hypothetical protein
MDSKKSTEKVHGLQKIHGESAEKLHGVHGIGGEGPLIPWNPWRSSMDSLGRWTTNYCTRSQRDKKEYQHAWGLFGFETASPLKLDNKFLYAKPNKANIVRVVFGVSH